MKTIKKIAKKILIAHIYLAVVVLTSQVFAQTGVWTPTGSMAGPRRDHTATLLPDGKVLINRGTGGAAELYDPVIGTFSTTGPSLGGGFAQGATATRLQDGRVLIVGGSPAEIYNPPTGTFTPAGNLNVARVGHTATLLGNGKVLIVGGQDLGVQQHIAAAELYDPVTNSFTLTGFLNVGRFSHIATLLQDGRVLIAGGGQITSPGFSTSLSSAELYDPATGAFILTGNLTQPRSSFLSSNQAPLLNNGKVLIVGGATTQAAEIFDPATGTFSPTGSMSIARSALTATVLSSGQVLVAGGVITLPGGGPGTTNLVEIYDPVSGVFSLAAFMIQARQQHAATLLPNGQVLVTGGFDFGVGFDLSSAELFSPPAPPPAAVSFYLHGAGQNDNPPTLFLDSTAPSDTTAKFKDSPRIKFNDRNPWKEIGEWAAAPALIAGTLTELNDLRVWLGLKNNGDQGALFDLRAEVYKNGVLVAAGETYCIQGLTRNPNRAKEAVVSFDSFSPVILNGATDELSLKVLTRGGTNGAGGFCGDHSNAARLRLYFDSVSRPSRFNALIAP
jgi:hypothetical protein